MTTLNISLPDPMKAFIEAQVQSGSYASASDYVRALVRDAQKRHALINSLQDVTDYTSSRMAG